MQLPLILRGLCVSEDWEGVILKPLSKQEILEEPRGSLLATSSSHEPNLAPLGAPDSFRVVGKAVG